MTSCCFNFIYSIAAWEVCRPGGEQWCKEPQTKKKQRQAFLFHHFTSKIGSTILQDHSGPYWQFLKEKVLSAVLVEKISIILNIARRNMGDFRVKKLNILQLLPWRGQTWMQIITINSNHSILKICMRHNIEHGKAWKQKELKLIKQWNKTRSNVY